MNEKRELESLTEILRKFKQDDKIKIALLYGSYARGTSHKRSDIDLALFIRAENKEEEMEIIDKFLMSVEKDVSILRLDDEDESLLLLRRRLKVYILLSPILIFFTRFLTGFSMIARR